MVTKHFCDNCDIEGSTSRIKILKYEFNSFHGLTDTRDVCEDCLKLVLKAGHFEVQ